MSFSELVVHSFYWGVLIVFAFAQLYWFAFPQHLNTERMLWSFGLAVVFAAGPLIISTSQ